MAIVTALRFTPSCGAICVDQESWYLNKRRTLFNDMLYPLECPELTQAFSVNWIYGAVGSPSFHFEIVSKARQHIQERWRKGGFKNVRFLDLSYILLEAFQQTQRRRINDQLKFLYGFTSSDLNQGYFMAEGEKIPIQNPKVKQHALEIINQKEKLYFGTLPTPNHACIIGVDADHTFSAFCIKEEQGVLSYQSGGFECLGDGRYAGAIPISKELNQQFLQDRRQGCGKKRGILTLISAVLEAGDYFCKVGGNIRLMVLDAEHPLQIREVADAPARLCLEITMAYRAQLLQQNQAEDLLDDLVFQEKPWLEMEKHFFQNVSSISACEKLLRGYKQQKLSEPLPPQHPLASLSVSLKEPAL